MERMIGVCGLVCTECEAYQATQANDMAWLQRVVEQWREEFEAPTLTLEYGLCDGCVSGSERLCGHCSECYYRNCAAEKGVANCGVCDEFEGCERIQNFIQNVPIAKKTMEEIRAQR